MKRNVSAKEVAKLLAEGKVIGRCVGRMEFGARALGNRSLLANPKHPNIVRKINEKIKNRDFFVRIESITRDSHSRISDDTTSTSLGEQLRGNDRTGAESLPNHLADP